jgi:hypothetical protein
MMRGEDHIVRQERNLPSRPAVSRLRRAGPGLQNAEVKTLEVCRARFGPGLWPGPRRPSG